MNTSGIRRIAIVGVGTMGQGIAQDVITHGYEISPCMCGLREVFTTH